MIAAFKIEQGRELFVVASLIINLIAENVVTRTIVMAFPYYKLEVLLTVSGWR